MRGRARRRLPALRRAAAAAVSAQRIRRCLHAWVDTHTRRWTRNASTKARGCKPLASPAVARPEGGSVAPQPASLGASRPTRPAHAQLDHPRVIRVALVRAGLSGSSPSRRGASRLGHEEGVVAGRLPCGENGEEWKELLEGKSQICMCKSLANSSSKAVSLIGTSSSLPTTL